MTWLGKHYDYTIRPPEKNNNGVLQTFIDNKSTWTFLGVTIPFTEKIKTDCIEHNAVYARKSIDKMFQAITNGKKNDAIVLCHFLRDTTIYRHLFPNTDQIGLNITLVKQHAEFKLGKARAEDIKKTAIDRFKAAAQPV